MELETPKKEIEKERKRKERKKRAMKKKEESGIGEIDLEIEEHREGKI